jgi:hypothetical protein
MSNLIYIPTCFGQHVTIIRGLLFLGLATFNSVDSVPISPPVCGYVSHCLWSSGSLLLLVLCWTVCYGLLNKLFENAR